MKKYLESRLRHLKPITGIKKLQGEASTRSFFRVATTGGSLVAMVYPGKNKDEIDRIVRLTKVYQEHGLNVPAIEETLDHRIILQQDLGDQLLQNAYTRAKINEKKKLLDTVAQILLNLHQIPVRHTAFNLDHARMKWEMVFFITHYLGEGAAGAQGTQSPFLIPPLTPKNGAVPPPPPAPTSPLGEALYRMVENIGVNAIFAHRDFHSRNMLCFDGRVYLVDFQDSLKAPPYYDIVSFAFDAYLDLKSLRGYLIDALKAGGMMIDEEQYHLSALQRNIKALGTFGYQVNVRGNLTYKKYIARTLRHIHGNPLFEKYIDPSLFPTG